MNQIALFGMIFAMLAVVAVMCFGLATMVRGKDVSGERSNKLMWWRIYFQGIALVFFALILYLTKN